MIKPKDLNNKGGISGQHGVSQFRTRSSAHHISLLLIDKSKLCKLLPPACSSPHFPPPVIGGRAGLWKLCSLSLPAPRGKNASPVPWLPVPTCQSLFHLFPWDPAQGRTATHEDGEDHRPSDDPPDRHVGIDVPAPMEEQPGMIRSRELGWPESVVP